MVWSVGFEPTKAASYTQRPVPSFSNEELGGLPIPLTTTSIVYNLYYKYTTDFMPFIKI